MEKYLMIRNKGKIIPQDIILMGSSTKRGSDKIGQFGSGAKYGLSWLLRNDCPPVIYSGREEISVDIQMTEHRGHIREVIYINGENTNITTELGLKWTAWMALREFISNAIDEGDEKIEVITTNYLDFHSLLDDKNTHIFIPVNDAIKEVMDKYDHYFAFDRIPDWVGDKGMVYLRRTNADINVYRKGIRCFDMDHKTMLDFNFADIPITEDRLIEGGIGVFDSYARELMEYVDDVEIIKAAIKSEYKDILPKYNEGLPALWLQAYRELIQEGYKFTTSSVSKVLGILNSGEEIPTSHFKSLIDNNIISNPMEAIFQHLDFVFSQVDGPSKEVEELLAQFGQFKVYFGKMDTYRGVKYRFEEKEFYVKDTLVNRKASYIAAECIMAHNKASELISQLLDK